ncbi:Beta-ketoacyl synthase, partial [Metarhizium majus ARSEF 297]
MGVRAETPACGVTDLERMRETFGKLMPEMPPINGALQMSIVARNTGDWSIAVRCKTVASWNLHAVLPSGLDFFILLSSASGLADVKGQTNYDAENTYEDALTRHRVSLGEKAASLYLSAMMDDGIVAEDRNLLNRILGYDALDPITRPAFYSIRIALPRGRDLCRGCHPEAGQVPGNDAGRSTIKQH